jgi:regulator of protease activity HflC (stomatin/prohibitin superfamily)
MIGFLPRNQEYEREAPVRLGRVKDGVRGPGVIFVLVMVDRVRRVSLRIVTLPIENVSAVISQIAQTTVRAVVRRHTLDETLSGTDEVSNKIRGILDKRGIRIAEACNQLDRRGITPHQPIPQEKPCPKCI